MSFNDSHSCVCHDHIEGRVYSFIVCVYDVAQACVRGSDACYGCVCHDHIDEPIYAMYVSEYTYTHKYIF